MAARWRGLTCGAEGLPPECRLRKIRSLNAPPAPASFVALRIVPPRRLARGWNRWGISRTRRSHVAWLGTSVKITRLHAKLLNANDLTAPLYTDSQIIHNRQAAGIRQSLYKSAFPLQ